MTVTAAINGFGRIRGDVDVALECTTNGLSPGAQVLNEAAGGAFLEWLEGKTLPGIAALRAAKTAA